MEKWVVVYYDNDDLLPCRISTSYLDKLYSDWKYVEFPNDAGKVNLWKRYRWCDDLMTLNESVQVDKMTRVRVKELKDITPYLVKQDIDYATCKLVNGQNRLKLLKEWRKKYNEIY
ncbi:MAG: hypothetical protein ACXADY_23130 [Candidatus Hodarchaeales archaeon]|jgi:hypothetical protein